MPHPEEASKTELQRENEALYRQLLVQGVLSILLPTEDLENPCLTALVEQIFSELIVGNVIVNKAAQPWLLFEGICIIARVLQQKKKGKAVDGEALSVSGTNRRQWSVHGLFVSIITWVMMLITSLRSCFATLVASSSLPSRRGRTDGAGGEIWNKTPAGKAVREPVPVLEFRLWTCLGNVSELGLRMPWLSGLLSLLKHGAVYGPGLIADVDGPLDR